MSLLDDQDKQALQGIDVGLARSLIRDQVPPFFLKTADAIVPRIRQAVSETNGRVECQWQMIIFFEEDLL
jgi:hypothetical protein